jgi:peroxin-16
MESHHPSGTYQVCRCSHKVLRRILQPPSLCRASFRLFLLKITHRPLVSPPIPERDFDPTMLPPLSNSSSPTLAPSSPSNSPPITPDHLRNNHTPLPPHSLLTTPSGSAVEDYLLPKALTTSDVKPSLSLIKTLSGPREWLAELIYVLRPLAYGEPPSNSRRSQLIDSCQFHCLLLIKIAVKDQIVP